MLNSVKRAGLIYKITSRRLQDVESVLWKVCSRGNTAKCERQTTPDLAGSNGHKDPVGSTDVRSQVIGQ